jgi:selenocysteine lyase/cysteine desulfurase
MDVTAEWIRSQLVGRTASIDTPFGERRVTYADYIASGRALDFVEDTVRHGVLPFYANTHTLDSHTGAVTTQLAHEAAEYIKAQLGAPEFKIAFCGSGSTAAIKRLQEILGLAVPGRLRERVLATMTETERPVVFVGPYEHHSNEVTWRETLAEVVEIPLCQEGLVDLRALAGALCDPRFAGRTLIGSFSAASNVTGTISDTRAIARTLHEHGALAFFDFAASAPYLPIDMRPGAPDGYDAVFLSPHKFVGGVGSPGVLVFDPALYDLTSAPSTAGGGTVTYVTSDGHDFTDDIEAREDAGTPAIVQKMRAALAFWVKEQFGANEIERRERRLARAAIERLRAHPRLHLLGSHDAARLSVVSFVVRNGTSYLHPRFVVRLLNDLFGIQSRGGCACAGPYGHRLLGIDEHMSAAYRGQIHAGYEGIKPGWTRVNFNYFIDDDEFEFLLDAVEFVADHGAAFLPVYDFDWHTGAWTHTDDVSRVPSLFDLPTVAVDGPVGAPPYARYLTEAWEHAAPITAGGTREVPADVPEELVFFTH